MLAKYKIEIKWAFIFIATLLTWSLIERLLGFHDTRIEDHATFSMFFFIPAIVLYVFALRDKKKKFFEGQMNYMQVLISGLILTMIVTIFNPLTQWIISYVIAPNYFENVIAYSVANGYDTQEGAEEYFNYESYAVQGTLFAFMSGIVTTLIVGIFSRSKK